MASYRAHWLDRHGYHKSTMTFHTDSDESAVRLVKPFLKKDDIEIWRNETRIVRLMVGGVRGV